LQALFLAKRGYRVSVFERRSDIRKAELVAGRSINLALSDRGWKALEHVGMSDAIQDLAIPMDARMIHDVEGNLDRQLYSKDGKAIYSVSRGGLNQKLLERADENEKVNLYFNQKCKDIDLNTNTIHFTNVETGKTTSQQFDRIFGTDGAFSKVRARLMRTDRFNYSQEYLTHGYKELVIPPNEDGSHRMDVNALHIWPRGEFMLIALPNLDGSYTVTLFFPFEGPTSFESIKTEQDVRDFFHATFPDAVPLMPTLVENYFENPTSSLVMIKCMPWHYEDKVCLMGDSSHAIVPFYGQGMNSGFEDCTVFEQVFAAANEDWTEAFAQFSEKRKPEADAICELALRNYIEMRDLTADPDFLLQKKIEKRFAKKFPDKWMPLYEQVTFSHIPYDEALRAGDRQNAIMKRVMDRADIEQVWDSEEVEQAILSELAKA
ncbi:MAG: FAD-dependent monooxygenase, partial [Flavobacteriales bacterium]|nr:FAD-dependent monooxygenase [Flavobacteriales bacterium]